jgi:hypothetical protein
MRRRIAPSDVRLGLDDPPAVPPPSITPREPRANQAASDADGISPEELSRRGPQAQLVRVEPKAPVRCGYHADREL